MPALLRGYRRIYNKWSVNRRGCVLNIEPSVNSSIIGLLLGPLSLTEFTRIGRREQWGKHYDCVTVTVERLENVRENVECATSIAKESFVRAGIIALVYKNIVEKGLQQLADRFHMPDFLVNYRNNTYDADGALLSLRQRTQ